MSSVTNFCATRCAKFNSQFIPPNVAVCLDYVFSSIIRCAVIKFFFGNDIVDSLLTMLVGNIIRFIIVRVEQIVCGLVQMARGCKCKTRCSGVTSSLSWIIVSFLLLAMVGPVAVSLLKETTTLLLYCSNIIHVSSIFSVTCLIIYHRQISMHGMKIMRIITVHSVVISSSWLQWWFNTCMYQDCMNL